MIVAGQLLLNDGAREARLAPGFLRVNGPGISEVVLGEIPAAADYGGPKAMIAPGFIDAHVHLPQFAVVGAHGLPLLDWLEAVVFPEESRWSDRDHAAAATHRAIDQLFSHGTTGVGAFATIHAEATTSALRIASDRGLRGVIGQTLMDRNAPPSLMRSAERLISETASLLDQFPSESRLAAAVTPRFAVTCTPDLLSAAGDLAAERKACIQSHLAETESECEQIAKLFGGIAYAEVYRRAGLLTNRSIYGHGIYLDESQLQLLRDSGATIAHCPTANSFLRSGAMDRRKYLEAGQTVTLGSDIGGGYERSMVRVARAMIETASRLGDDYPTAAEAWRQITRGNAEALGWEDAGQLRPGVPADLVMIEPDIPWFSTENPAALERLLFSWDDRWIRGTWVLGRRVHPVL